VGTEDDDRALLRTVAAKVDMLNSQFDRVALALERLVAVEVHLQGMNSRIGRVEDEASKVESAARETGSAHEISLSMGFFTSVSVDSHALKRAVPDSLSGGIPEKT